MARRGIVAAAAALFILVLVAPAQATPVCTDGYKGGPPAATNAAAGSSPRPERAQAYVQYTTNPLGFNEYQHGIEYLAQKYPRWVAVFTLKDRYGAGAVSAGPDKKRPGEAGDTGDGRDIRVVKITDHERARRGQGDALLLALGPRQRARRARGRPSHRRGPGHGRQERRQDRRRRRTTTTRPPAATPEFHEHEVAELLPSSRPCTWSTSTSTAGRSATCGATPPLPYSRGNSLGTDLNRQMPTVGRINPSRNPLQETEMRVRHRFMHEVAAAGPGGQMAYGADIHGELNSQAYMDIMYPAGEFDSVDHRRLMAIAERTKSVIDATLYDGHRRRARERHAAATRPSTRAPIPLKPAHWATVWDTLGYTDTGFIGDYMATDLGVTGMDYEIVFNHTVPEKVWNVYLQENHINATRGIIKTAMAYALFQARGVQRATT